MKLFTSKQTKEAERSVLDELLRKEVAASDALKAKEALLNKIDRELPVIIAAKKSELADIEFRLRTAREKETSEVITLEERRRAALKPVTEEQEALQKTKDGIQDMMLRLDKEREEARNAWDDVKRRAAEVQTSTQNFERVQRDVLFMLEQRRIKADESVVVAVEAISRLKDEQERTQELTEGFRKQEESSKRAEVLARAAMASADAQIARAQKEQQNIIEQRKSLAIAIKELKKRGLWSKRLETVTK